jgi:hypothetical protein
MSALKVCRRHSLNAPNLPSLLQPLQFRMPDGFVVTVNQFPSSHLSVPLKGFKFPSPPTHTHP